MAVQFSLDWSRILYGVRGKILSGIGGESGIWCLLMSYPSLSYSFCFVIAIRMNEEQSATQMSCFFKSRITIRKTIVLPVKAIV